MDPASSQSPKVVSFPGLSGRSQDGTELLARVRALATGRLGAALAECFAKVDDTLFDLLNKAGSPDDHQDYLNAMREVRLRRDDAEQRFRDHIAQGFAAVSRGSKLAADAQISGGSASGELSLISEEELEEQLGAKMLAEAIDREFGPVLVQLDRRIGSLAGVELGPNTNPVGSGHVAAAVLCALRTCEIAVGVKLILFKLFERELTHTLSDLYSDLNQQLVDAGVLPGLKLVQVRKGRRAEAPGTEGRDQDAGPARDSARATGGLSETEIALFETLHDLLRGYRTSGNLARHAPATEDARTLDSEQMLSLLSMLQGEMPAGVRAAIKDPAQSLAQRLKQEIVASVVRLGLDPQQAALRDGDEDAIDLVGMLFEVLLDERDLDSAVRDLFGRLVVPFIKVAMMDRRMFLQRSHPARRLLNGLAEACEGNRGESPQERALMDKVRDIVERLTVEFNENIAVFETLEEEFRAFLEQHRRRIELAERRAAEAQRGRERLEQARALASAEIEARVAGRDVPPTIASVLSRYWSHHLTVTALRDGNDSQRYRDAVSAGDALTGAVDAAMVGETLLAPAIGPMRAGLQQILGTSGCVGEAAEEVVREVTLELRRIARGEASDTVAEAVAAAEPPPIETPKPDPAVELGLAMNASDLDYEPADAERIRGLPVGTWVEFVDEQGQTQPAKLSWISPISRRLMFVNRRGIRFCVASSEELAAMMRQSRLLIREIDTAFEQAMHQVLGKLDTSGRVRVEQFAA
ncbi:MAG TPA: DUF1631 domain-containing protein [Xanthomonadaceae bacterium]|nr:DUF1631 domain-containing protein [Xanthomonadaceae bacterium]